MTEYIDTDDLFKDVQDRIATMTGGINRTALDVNDLYVKAVRERAREWGSSDLMDLAAWLEGSL